MVMIMLCRYYLLNCVYTSARGSQTYIYIELILKSNDERRGDVYIDIDFHHT